MKIRNREFDLYKNTYVMGILNVTPDSFSDGGKHNELDAAVSKALEMIKEGAEIIDIGGESTRPGFEKVSLEDELSRVIPVIEGIRSIDKNIIISVDTTKAEVARKAIEAGADIINDVSGFLLDEKMAMVAASLDAPSVLMHDGAYFDNDDTKDDDYIGRVIKELKGICDSAIEKGVKKDNIIIDPGVGFGKTVEENLMLVRDLKRFEELGYPILLGCSRKSLIGKSLDLDVNNRLEGTLTTSIYGACNGAGIIRIHDVKENVRALNMLKSIQQLKAHPSV